ncbi:junctophilin-1 isoform X1 [Osmia bicornis bicornis]|uniref:junctophilin-1 isoform X1 n=2 Tax=Osmia bicornis bicornis TaxID=1437191 RepID=UPI001EAF6548|nr:junctophilin-1 isoform X1 [Osmia bicornis bicornis]
MQQQPQSGQQSGAPNGVAGGAQLPQTGGIGSAQPGATGTTTTVSNRAQVNGGRFDFDDGGTYCGGWEDGKAHGHGVCTGPKGQGAYSGSWHYGFEVSGVYTWPSGSAYEGQWQNGKRHGLGMETRGRWIYRGEWTQGFKGRYGVRQSTTSTARYEGTWASGLQDGYGSETYADSGTYQGQWCRGMRHGYGVRASAPFGLASHYKPSKQVRASLTSLRSADGGGAAAPTPEPTDRRDRRVDDSRGGFVLKARSDDPPARRKSLTEKSLKKGILSGLKIRKQRSTGDLEKRGTTGGGSIRSNASSASWMSTESSQSQASASVHTDSNASFVIEDEQMDASVTETYLGEWKNDKRTGFGISERSDGLRYEGEWFNNRKYGYGVTKFRDGTKEEGKYKNNVLITSQKKKHLFLIRSAKFRERIEAAVSAAQRASKIALQKADIAISRTATARGRAELADIAAEHAREDSELAQQTAKQFAPDFRQPGLERLRNREIPKYVPPPQDTVPGKSILHKTGSVDQPGSTPMKSSASAAEATSTTTTSATSTASNVMQSIRRASMKPQTSNQLPQNQLPQNQLTQNEIPNQVTPAQLVNQLPMSQLNQTTMGAQNPYQTQYPQSMAQNPVQQYPNSIPNQYQQASQFQTGQYAPQNQYPGQSSPYNQPPYQAINPPQVDQYLYQQQQPLGPQGYQNVQAYANQQTTVPNQYGPGQMNQYNSQQLYGQQQQPPPPQHQQTQIQQQYQPDGVADAQRPPSSTSIRRNSRVLSPQDRPGTIGQTLNDRLDHYKRPPSRDSSVDRYARAHSRLTGSRQPSIDKTVTNPPQDILDRSTRAPSAMRSGTPLNGSVVGSGTATPTYAASTSSQFEGALLKNRNLGQDILPSQGQPKRTESLYVTPGRGPTVSGGASGGGSGVSKAMPTPSVSLQRKKSLPDVAQPILLTATAPLSREEVSVLSSMRREEIRRQIDESERLRANPLLYLVSPQVKDWFSRQQLVMLVLFINISLALMFFKLLT